MTHQLTRSSPRPLAPQKPPTALLPSLGLPMKPLVCCTGWPQETLATYPRPAHTPLFIHCSLCTTTLPERRVTLPFVPQIFIRLGTED